MVLSLPTESCPKSPKALSQKVTAALKLRISLTKAFTNTSFFNSELLGKTPFLPTLLWSTLGSP